MKLTDKQKTIIYKSLKLNEDFFDDFEDNELVDDVVNDSFSEPDYTYHIHFIIYTYPLIKDVNRNGLIYYFEDPKYKPIIESGILSMKKALNCILQATPIVTDYSEPKFCTPSEKITKEFPFITNGQLNEFETKFNNKQIIILKTSINLSIRKNEHNLLKMFYSFWRLEQIYNKLVSTNKFNINKSSTPYINIEVYKNNPYKKPILYQLMPSDVALTPTGLELINFLNSKDETD